jgi:hypothetical protein
MRKISPKIQPWLKFIHTVFACMWVGSGIILCAKQLTISATDGKEFYGIMSTLDFIDMKILVPGAFGVLLTGLIYSIWTNWGWFKHRWVTVKWIICIFGIIFGWHPLGTLMSSLVEISKVKGLDALTDPVFIHNQNMMIIFGTFQLVTILTAVCITAIKPWRKIKH